MQMGGGTGSSEEAKYTVTVNESEGLPEVYAQLLQYWVPEINPEPFAEQGHWADLNDGTMLKAGTAIRYKYAIFPRGPVRACYYNGEEITHVDDEDIKSAFKMPAQNITIDILCKSEYNSTIMEADTGKEKPEGWVKLTVDAKPYMFRYYSYEDGKYIEEDKFELWVNPFYKINTTLKYKQLLGRDLVLPKGIEVKTDIDKIYTKDTVVKLEYSEPDEITLVLHKKNGKTAEIKTRKRSYEDIADEIRTHESKLDAGEKFVCWSDNPNHNADNIYYDKAISIYESNICLLDKAFYNKGTNSQEYKNIKVNDDEKQYDLYEVVTKDNIVYELDTYRHYIHEDNGKKIIDPEISSINLVKKGYMFKDALYNIDEQDLFNLYKVVYDSGELTQINFNDKVTQDCYIALEKKKIKPDPVEPGPGPDPGPGPEPDPGKPEEPKLIETKRTIFVYSQPKLNYANDANPKLDITAMIVCTREERYYQKNTGEKYGPIVREAEIPYQHFNEVGITTEPAQGDALNASHNNKCIKVMLDGKIAYSDSMMTIKESSLYEPVYEQKTVTVGDDIELDIIFLDQNSTETPKPEASTRPRDYKVTAEEMLPATSMPYNGYFSHTALYYEGGQTITIPVTVTYKDGSVDKTQIVYHVNKENNEDSAIPTVNPIQEGSTEISGTGQPGAFIAVLIGNKYVGGVNVGDDGTWKIENIATDLLKAGAELRIVQTEDNKAASSVNAKVAENPNNKDSDRYETKATKIEKEFGVATTEDEVIAAVSVEKYPQDKTAPVITVDDPSKLPDGNTAGTTYVDVTVKYPDGSEDKLKVEVYVKEEEQPIQTDADKYNPTATNITKNFGEATTEDEIKNAVKIADYPADAVKQPVITVDDPSKLPDGQTAGDFNVAVTVTYPDQSTDKVTVKVTVKAKIVDPEENKDNEKYNPTATNITKNFGEATTEDEIKNAVKIADYPADAVKQPVITVDDPSKLPDGQTVGDFDVAVTVIYPDQSTDKVTVKVTVKAKIVDPEENKDNEKYNPTATNITKNFGEATTEEEIKNAVKIADYPADAVKQPVITVDDPSKLPDGQTVGDFDVAVTVTYPDQSTDKVKVKVIVKAKVIIPDPEDEDDDDYRPYWPDDDYYRPRRPRKPIEDKKPENKPVETNKEEEKPAVVVEEKKDYGLKLNEATLPVTLTDIPEGEAGEAIRNMVARGILKGMSATEFKGEIGITRAMVGEVLMRLSEDKSMAEVNFKDINGSEWYYDSVKWGVKHGIFKGYPDGTFRPNNNVSRQEFALIIYRFLMSKGMNLDQVKTFDYVDANMIPQWSSMEAKYMDTVGFILGKTDTIYDASGDYSREELVLTLNRLVNWLNAHAK